ncbi:MAG: uroporphyrinogen-III C-methyltransferase [Thermodesulfovibrionales bacterium]|nr:uroporphyrinogen-III C-methyltransferase [Thermodesulfovibrionales bacterium]
MKGKVYIVGAGPGDIGLFTIKGLKCLQMADVVIYDFHINAQILNYLKEEAEFVYAGKRGGHHELSQEDINRLLVEKAKEGKIVVRLKGGDPFVFGRGGEEAEVLAREGIPFEIIPGITSAIAVPAYAGIPLTHRQYSSLFTVITGNEDITKPESKINWKALAELGGTLVFLMAVKNLEFITRELIKNGKDPDTPAALIRWGTRADQVTYTGTLKTIPEMVKLNDIKPPAIFVTGDVVRLRETLSWYEKKPLFGHRILLTGRDSSQYEKLEFLGAEIIEFPAIDILPPEDWTELDRSIKGLESYQWLIFTSKTAVKYFMERLFQNNRDIRDLKGIKICAVGTKTEEELKRYGLRVDILPDEFRAEGLMEVLNDIYKGNLSGLRFLFPRAENAREVIPEKIKALGGFVDAPVTYRSQKPESHAKRIKRFFKEGRITVAVFTSGAAFKNFVEIVGEEAMEFLENVKIAVIGPVTRKAVESTGLRVSIMPERATNEDLVEAIIEYLSSD